MFSFMDLPEPLCFDPAPTRSRRDGWTPDHQRRFILLLANGARPGEAARRVGRSRTTAYALRDRPGGESFAASWDAAIVVAEQGRDAIRMTPPDFDTRFNGGIEMMLVPRYYRGRLIGFVQREDTRAALRVVRTLDRLADGINRAGDRAAADVFAAGRGSGQSGRDERASGCTSSGSTAASVLKRGAGSA